MASMCFMRFLTWQQIVESYQIPMHLRSEVREILVPVGGADGDGDSVFFESDVDERLMAHFGGAQPASNDPRRFAEEGLVEDVVAEKNFGGKDKEALDFLTPLEAARLMRLNHQTVMKYCREGTLGATKIGNKWIIPRKSVDQFLKGQWFRCGKGGAR